MKATKAYIASLGTTGVLLGASLLMLAMVSAVVAFDAWPEETVATPPRTVLVVDKPAAIRVSAKAALAGSSASKRSAGAIAGKPALRGGALRTIARSLGGVNGITVRGGQPSGAPTTPVTVPKSLQPLQQGASPIIEAVSHPGGTAAMLANGAQSAADAAGVSVGKMSPDLGHAVSGTGDVAAQTVRSLPLPQQLPGQ